jgi:hypothetical protein
MRRGNRGYWKARANAAARHGDLGWQLGTTGIAAGLFLAGVCPLLSLTVTERDSHHALSLSLWPSIFTVLQPATVLYVQTDPFVWIIGHSDKWSYMHCLCLDDQLRRWMIDERIW